MSSYDDVHHEAMTDPVLIEEEEALLDEQRREAEWDQRWEEYEQWNN